MPRTRDIKPSFFKNEELASCDPLARILFAGLWCWCDKLGRVENRPLRLKAEILPYDNANVEELLQQLESKGFILRYEVSGKKCIQIVSWERHGNPHPNEPEFGLPEPLTEISGQVATCRDKSLQNPFNSNFNSNSNSPPPTPPSGGEGKEKTMPEIPQSLSTTEFCRAWTEWLAHRRERKPHVTPRSAAMALRKLQEIGPERAVAAIEHSIAQGYQGIVEPKAWQAGGTPRKAESVSETIAKLRKEKPL